MKRNLLLLLLTVSCALTSLAQEKAIHLKNGYIKTGENLLKTKFFNRTEQNISFADHIYTLIQLDKVPDSAARKELAGKGIFLYHPVSNNTYFAEIKKQDVTTLPKNITALYSIPAALKIDNKLAAQPADRDADNYISVMFFGTVSKDEVTKALMQTGASIADTKIAPSNAIFVRASTEAIQKIAALPFVSYVGRQKLKDVPLNYNNRSAHSLDALNAVNGRNLQGKGVTVGVGDDANPSTHLDFSGRLIVRTPAGPGVHGTHTTGTVGGAGLVNPMYRGMAPGVTLINQYFSDIIVNTPVYFSDNHMILTNNSYFTGADFCPGDGDYDVLSNYTDAQLNDYPTILHVFAAGNDGGNTCVPFPAGYGTVKSGFQCAKNVLTVGNIANFSYTIDGGSSRGPLRDGRLKPEIVAGGSAIVSTVPNNGYAQQWGTSMSAPTVTGAVALLYERYRQLHGGTDPNGALIKALTCNAAEDKGTPGPDYTFGFGTLNARRAVEAIENNTYFTNTISNGANQNYTLNNIPAGAQVKIMLYWSDPAAAPNALISLVNNLDLTVTDGGGTLHHPLILDPLHVTDAAKEGVDNLNNIEQVVINNATAGNIAINVAGSGVATGSQQYIVAYQIIPPSVTVEYPSGNEIWAYSYDPEYIRWSYTGNDVNTFSVDYSTNNGASWTNIRNNVGADSTFLPWLVPGVATDKALVRVTRNNVGYSDLSDYNFTILGQPSLAAIAQTCPGYAKLVWSAVALATSYDIMMLRGDSMQVVKNMPAPATTYTLAGLSKDSVYFFAVRAVLNGSPGRRSTLQAIKPTTGTCTDASSNNDFQMDSILSPVSGRLLTSTALKINTPIKVRIRNADNIGSTGNYQLSYQVNNGPIFTETSNVSIPQSSTSLPLNNTLVYTFGSTYDFSAPGTYTLKAWVKNTGDLQVVNDTLTTIIRQLANAAINLSPAFTENFESMPNLEIQSKVVGLAGLDRGDFNTSITGLGRLRTFVNTGFARSGNRCITLDQSINNSSSAADSLMLTFNLSNYTSADQLWLDFFYKNHGIDFSLPGNKAWIRGSDADAWLPVSTLETNVSDFGIYKPAQSVNITEVLAAASPAQTVTSSFQVKLGEQGFTSANSVNPSGNLDDGYSFDDVSITKALNDVGMKTLLSPDPVNVCQLGSAEQIKVLIKNYSAATLTNIPIAYSINGATVTETLATLPPGDFTYTFTQTANLAAFQRYIIRAWVKSGTDNYPNNDTLRDVQIHTVPYINTFPYLEGFENNDGNWYTDGVYNSWAWGTPAKPVINKAANGQKIWTTNLTGNYNDNELSYLYSPCFDVSGLTNPMLSFSHIFELEACDCDGHWVEYSVDGVNWIKLGSSVGGTNWYNNATKNIWQQPSNPLWHVASYDLPKGISRLHLRFVMNSDPGVNFDGVGIDDVNIFEKTDIYSGANISSGIAQNVNGNNWIDFKDGSGKIIASVNANGQNPGNTIAKVYFNPTSQVRVANKQYYLDRNIVLQTENPIADSVGVRFYFLDSEIKKLMSVSVCDSCSTISDPYESGVTQYSGNVSNEDGSLDNNILATGVYRFILPHKELKIIPYNSGYYAEYKVNRFSEFWINGGGAGQDVALPLTLLSFNATLHNAQGILTWSTDKETNTSKFIIEKSTDGIHFTAIGEVAAMNTSTINNYHFTDDKLANGSNYYRLQMMDIDGRFTYSPIRNILYTTDAFSVMVYPNPVSGNWLNVKTSANCTRLELKDATGKRIRLINASGKQNALPVSGISSGLYVLVVTTEAGIRIEKIIKD